MTSGLLNHQSYITVVISLTEEHNMRMLILLAFALTHQPTQPVHHYRLDLVERSPFTFEIDGVCSNGGRCTGNTCCLENGGCGPCPQPKASQ